MYVLAFLVHSHLWCLAMLRYVPMHTHTHTHTNMCGVDFAHPNLQGVCNSNTHTSHTNRPRSHLQLHWSQPAGAVRGAAVNWSFVVFTCLGTLCNFSKLATRSQHIKLRQTLVPIKPAASKTGVLMGLPNSCSAVLVVDLCRCNYVTSLQHHKTR